MANAEVLLRALLGKAYKIPKTEIDRILSDNTDDAAGETEVLEKDTTRVEVLKTPKRGSTFQDGYAKGKKESLETFEKELAEHFQIDPETLAEENRTGLNLVENIIAAKAKTGGSNLTEDQIKASPVYQKAEQGWKKQVKEANDQWKAKYDQLESGHKKAAVFQTVSGKVLNILKEMNPVLPTDAKVANTWQNNFVNSFKDYDFELQDDGRIVAMKDGKVIEDGHGATIDFETLVKGRAPEYFEFKANNGGANAGNGKPGEGGSGSGSGKQYPAGITKPKTFDDYAKIVSDTNIKLEDRQIVREVWEQEQAAGSQ